MSALLFATARQVAVDQHLMEPAADLAERRRAFLAELRGIVGDMRLINDLAREQFMIRDGALRHPAASS